MAILPNNKFKRRVSLITYLTLLKEKMLVALNHPSASSYISRSDLSPLSATNSAGEDPSHRIASLRIGPRSSFGNLRSSEGMLAICEMCRRSVGTCGCFETEAVGYAKDFIVSRHAWWKRTLARSADQLGICTTLKWMPGISREEELI